MLQLKETGRVVEIKPTIAKVAGLTTCLYGQQVHFPGAIPGMMMGFDESEVAVLLLKGKQNIRLGDPVYGVREVFDIPVGDDYIGRIVNPLGEPLDGKGPVKCSVRRPIFCDPPSVLERLPIEEPLETGIKAIDFMIPIGRGQRELIIGDRMTGKTTIVTDSILSQKGKGMVCIYCCIGKSESTLNKVLQLLQESGAMEYTIVVAATASSPIGQQYLAPYSACSIGEYFMHQGNHVLVGFDDFTRHAWIYRQLSLLLERSPGRDAYPGDIFYLHSQMIERAANMLPELGGGSMTFLPIVETMQGDVTGYVPSNLISMTDGQVYLNSALFSEGFKPAVDLGLSISRIGSKVQWQAIRKLSGPLRLEYLQYRELERLSRVKSGGAEEIEVKLRHGRVLTELLKQDKSRPVPFEESVILLYFFNKGQLDSLGVPQLKYFKQNLQRLVNAAKPGFLSKLREKKELSEEIQADLQQLLTIATEQGWFKEIKESA